MDSIRYMSKSPTVEPETVAAVLKAMSHPHRLRMLVRLAGMCSAGGACCEGNARGRCVGKVARGLGVSPSTVSHHLKELRAAGLITMERRGQTIECAVNVEALRDVQGFFSALLPARAEGAKRRAAPPSQKGKGKR